MVASDTGDSSDGTPAESGKKTTAKTTKSTRKPAKKTARKSVPEAAAEETAQSAAPAKRTAASRPAKKSTTDETGVKKVAAKNTTTDTTETTEDSAAAVPAARAAAPATPGELPVRPGEDPWTPEEVDGARSELTGEADRLRTEIAASEDALAGLMRDSGDGAGDDEADTGSKNITREHELALAANAREMLYQTEKALDRLAAGTYGTCEVCGKPIGKARMQAFPRATLCVEDKQRQERRV